MTVEDTNNRKDYGPDGVEDTFIYNFRVDTASDMVVYADGELYEEPFTITGLGEEEGGDVVFDDPPIASITTLTLIREMPLTQATDYPPLGPFPAPSHEQALDKLTWICQQLQEQLSRSLIAPVDQEGDYTLPPYAAGEFWKWDESVQEIVTATLEDLGVVSIGLTVGDVVKLIDVGGGVPGWPAISSLLLTGVSADVQAAIDASIPVGDTIAWNTDTPPNGYLEEDGSAISRTTYSDLFAVIGTQFGVGDGSTTFNLDDKRGYFIRGWDHGAGVDPDAAARTDRGDGTTGDNIGTKEIGQNETHNHTSNLAGNIADNTATFGSHGSTSNNSLILGTTFSGGDEARPINTNVMFCMKY